jgi:hypothetical protein
MLRANVFECFTVAGRDITLTVRVSFETSFDLKQQNGSQLVSALSETKNLFQLFRFYYKTESLDVSIEPEQTEEQPKQCDREHILVFFSENLGLFWFVLVCFGLFWLFWFYTKTESLDVSIEPKQTEDQPKQFETEHIWVFFRKFRVVSI